MLLLFVACACLWLCVVRWRLLLVCCIVARSVVVVRCLFWRAVCFFSFSRLFVLRVVVECCSCLVNVVQCALLFVVVCCVCCLV